VTAPTGRRGLAATVVATAAGAGVVLLGASRAWSAQIVAQPPPLSPHQVVHTGASLAPALPALGLVALAGVGGLLATHGTARRIVGGLVTAAAAGVVALVVAALAGGGIRPAWPVVCLAGAAVVAAGGAVGAVRGAAWPGLGRRYERTTLRSAEPAPADGETGASRDLWDALDRGEDPTRG
jgi:hypothetical protein